MNFSRRRVRIFTIENPSSADATAILQSVGNPDKYGLSEQGAINADINGEVGITPDDAIVIKKIDAGMISASDLPL